MAKNFVTDILVATNDAGRSYKRGGAMVTALAPTTCRVIAGSSIALVGPSGSGKSTLLHLMAGLDAPTTGTIEWPTLGLIEDLRPGKIAVVFQAPSLMAALTVAENVELPLILMNDADGARDKAATALARLGLDSLASKLPEELSGGQAQRVALARAMASRPNLILADEPTGQLDQATGSAVMNALLAWTSEKGAAVVVATHDKTIAGRMDHVWRMDHGHLTLPTAKGL